jgi:hypothetical protein
VLVDPRNTSRTCPACGYIDKANRVSQSVFACVVCGFSGLADHIAALNIRILGRAAVIRPYVSDAQTTAQRQGQAAPLWRQWSMTNDYPALIPSSAAAGQASHPLLKAAPQPGTCRVVASRRGMTCP